MIFFFFLEGDTIQSIESSEIADDNSEWEEKPRISDVWNLSDVLPASVSLCAAEAPLTRTQQPHFIRASRRNLPSEQSWKRQALPSVWEDKSWSAGECRGRSG